MYITIKKSQEKTFKKLFPCSIVENQKTWCKTETWKEYLERGKYKKNVAKMLKVIALRYKIGDEERRKGTEYYYIL